MSTKKSPAIHFPLYMIAVCGILILQEVSLVVSWEDRQIVEGEIVRKIALIIFLVLISVYIAGCGSPLFQALFQEQEWSENYALADGVTCTAMEMIDGDINTAGKTVFPEGTQGRAIYGTYPNAEAEVVLPEKKSIHKIVIRSKDLDTFEVLASTGGDKQWKLIKEFDNNKEEEIVIRASVTTDKILIRARPLSSVSTATINRRGGFFGRSRTINAPEIQEIELYGFK